MKSVELPDQLFIQAAEIAGNRGVSLEDFLVEALREKIADVPAVPKVWPVPPPKMSREDAEIINARLAEFGNIEWENWR